MIVVTSKNEYFTGSDGGHVLLLPHFGGQERDEEEDKEMGVEQEHIEGRQLPVDQEHVGVQPLHSSQPLFNVQLEGASERQREESCEGRT